MYWTVLGTLSFTLLAMTVAQGNWFQIPPPPPPPKKKHSHKAVRHNTEAVLSGVGGFFWFLVFCFFFSFCDS